MKKFKILKTPKYISGASHKALNRFESSTQERDMAFKQQSSMVNTVGATVLDTFVPGAGAIANVATQLDTAITGDGTDEFRNYAGQIINPLSTISYGIEAIKTGDIGVLSPFERAKRKREELAEKERLRFMANKEAMRDSGNSMYQMDINQFAAARAKKGAKLKRQLGGLLTNLGKDFVFTIPDKKKEFDLKKYLEWYALKENINSRKKGGMIKKSFI